MPMTHTQTKEILFRMNLNNGTFIGLKWTLTGLNWIQPVQTGLQRLKPP